LCRSRKINHAIVVGQKKNLASTTTRRERMEMVDWGNPELPISQQAELLGINRSSLYYKPVQPSPEEVAIKHRIDEIYTKYPFYGSRRIVYGTLKLNHHRT